MKLSRKNRMPAARWIGLVPLGIGDGNRTEFALPEDVERAIIFVRSYRMGKEYRTETPSGQTKTVLHAGQVISDETGRRVKFEEAPEDGAAVTAVALDHEGGSLGFQVYPMTMAVNAALSAKVEEEKKATKTPKDKGLDGIVFYKLAFKLLVKAWRDVQDEDTGEQWPCDEETKGIFLDVADGGYFGSFVAEASQDLHQLVRSEAKAEEGS